MKKLLVLAVCAVIAAIPASASAGFLTWNPLTIQSVYQTFVVGTHFALPIQNTVGGAKFVGNLNTGDPYPSFGAAEWGFKSDGLDFFGANHPGQDLASLGWSDLSAYSGFALTVTNQNEHDWDFVVGVIDINGKRAVSGATLSPTVSANLLADFASAEAGFDATQIYLIGFGVSGQTPVDGLDGTDYTYEFSVASAPVPEPGTLALFGFGLAGAAASYRRKRAAKKA